MLYNISGGKFSEVGRLKIQEYEINCYDYGVSYGKRIYSLISIDSDQGRAILRQLLKAYDVKCDLKEGSVYIILSMTQEQPELIKAPPCNIQIIELSYNHA